MVKCLSCGGAGQLTLQEFDTLKGKKEEEARQREQEKQRLQAEQEKRKAEEDKRKAEEHARWLADEPKRKAEQERLRIEAEREQQKDQERAHQAQKAQQAQNTREGLLNLLSLPFRAIGFLFLALVAYPIPTLIVCGIVGVIIYNVANSMSGTSNQSSTMPHSVSVKPQVPPPATSHVNVNIQGYWQGWLSKNPATINIDERKMNKFSGILTVKQPQGAIRLAVQGVLSSNNGIAMQEVRVVSHPHLTTWTLGNDVGFIRNSGHNLSGTGGDGVNAPYSWSFSR